jgi:hypothetical protein
MIVYRLNSDVNNFQYFLPANDEGDKLVMDCTKKIETWSPPEVFIYKPLYKKGDFYKLVSSF